jgi:hypothetical protein
MWMHYYFNTMSFIRYIYQAWDEVEAQIGPGQYGLDMEMIL